LLFYLLYVVVMKFTLSKRTEKEYNLTTLEVKAGIRYYEDVLVDWVEDVEWKLTPCIVWEYWCPIINLDTWVITNWTKWVTAVIHAKVCDDGSYYLKDETGEIILSIEDNYVPSLLAIDDDWYGDYIIMTIDWEWKIKDWKSDISSFTEEE